NVVLRVKGAASQTANLQEWQDSAGSVPLWVTGDLGKLNSISGVSFSNNYSGGTTLTTRSAYPSLIPLIVKGAASQTANLQEWQNSAGTVLSSITSTGLMNTTVGLNANALYIGNGYLGANIQSAFSASTASYVPIVVRGAPSQTANLQEWQTSGGTVQSRIDQYGQVVSSVSSYLSTLYAGSGISGSVGQANVSPFAASTIGLVVRGAASQTADLQEWQNSAGTALVSIDSNGILKSAYLTNVANNGSYFNFTVGTALLYSRNIASPTFAVVGVASQTADLQEWQDSAGTVLAKVTAAGAAQFVSIDGGSA
ncbi:hypothetical protein UFOVP965_1, partial [uncultured Caudovirales phage]